MDCIRTSYQARSGSQRKEGLNILPSFLLSLLFAIPAVPHQIPNLIDVAEAQEPAPVAVVSLTTREEMEAYIRKEYPQRAERVIQVIDCESDFNPQAINRNDPNGGSKGLGQFQDATFVRYSKLVGINSADVWNPKDSIDTVIYMFKIGAQSQWSCYNLLYGV